MKVSASFLSSTYKPLDLIKKIEKTNADYLHVDIMDGKFTKNKTFTFSEIENFSKHTTKPLDIHLMVTEPIKYIEKYALLNTEYITFHYEGTKKITDTIDKIKNCGIKCGISIKPNTNISEIFPYLKDIDLVLIMSVEPGKSGQPFLESVLYKIEVLKKKIEEEHLNIIISIDGGINEETALLAKEKGVNMLTSASYLHEGNIIERVNTLKSL